MINISELNKIDNMSDEQLKKSILQLATSAGINPQMLGGILSDISSVRKAVASVSQKDIDEIIANTGQENVGKLADILKNNTQE